MNTKDKLLQYIEEEYAGKYDTALNILKQYKPTQIHQPQQNLLEENKGGGILKDRYNSATFYLKVQFLHIVGLGVDGDFKKLQIKDAIDHIAKNDQILIDELIRGSPNLSQLLQSDDPMTIKSAKTKLKNNYQTTRTSINKFITRSEEEGMNLGVAEWVAEAKLFM